MISQQRETFRTLRKKFWSQMGMIFRYEVEHYNWIWGWLWVSPLYSSLLVAAHVHQVTTHWAKTINVVSMSFQPKNGDDIESAWETDWL